MTKISLYPTVTLPLRGTDLMDVSEDAGAGAYITKRLLLSDMVSSVSNFPGGYDNTSSGITATTLQGAIDEVHALFPGTLAGLTDTAITSPITDQYLAWDGSAWVNQSFAPDIRIYTADGTLTGDRVMNQNGNTLSFTNTGGVNITGSTTNAALFIENTGTGDAIVVDNGDTYLATRTPDSVYIGRATTYSNSYMLDVKGHSSAARDLVLITSHQNNDVLRMRTGAGRIELPSMGNFVGTGSLPAGALYVDTEANITSNGDYFLAWKL